MADEKKIIVDEDWKSQVAAEKAQQAKTADAPAAAGPQAAAGDMPMPPATWELLLTTLATEAMISLGQIPHPGTGQPVQQFNQAKYLIDTIEMLREKSKGNLTPEESQLTDYLLHQLRIAYVGLTTPT